MSKQTRQNQIAKVRNIKSAFFKEANNANKIRQLEQEMEDLKKKSNAMDMPIYDLIGKIRNAERRKDLRRSHELRRQWNDLAEKQRAFNMEYMRKKTQLEDLQEQEGLSS